LPLPLPLPLLPQVITEKHAHHVATLLDTKGPEIRTAMLKGGKDLELKAGGWYQAWHQGLQAD
jgi:pyruvate kinase